MQSQAERFIERGTDYKMENATLSVYETNCPCKGVEFIFNKYMITLMLSGHKTIAFSDSIFEFFPGTLYIPQKNSIQKIDIPNASLTNPSKCLVLDIKASFLENFVNEVLQSKNNEWFTNDISNNRSLNFFLSNDKRTINCFKRLYNYQLNVNSRADELITEMILKELILEIFKTEGKNYLMDICRSKIDDKIQDSLLYIRANLTSSITIDDLSYKSGLGKTNYFNKFRKATGLTPVNYIIKKRIEYAKNLIQPNSNLRSIAFQCGFNTYEHFCKSFKKTESITPSHYKKMQTQEKVSVLITSPQ